LGTVCSKPGKKQQGLKAEDTPKGDAKKKKNRVQGLKGGRCTAGWGGGGDVAGKGTQKTLPFLTSTDMSREGKLKM